MGSTFDPESESSIHSLPYPQFDTKTGEEKSEISQLSSISLRGGREGLVSRAAAVVIIMSFGDCN